MLGPDLCMRPVPGGIRRGRSPSTLRRASVDRSLSEAASGSAGPAASSIDGADDLPSGRRDPSPVAISGVAGGTGSAPGLSSIGGAARRSAGPGTDTRRDPISPRSLSVPGDSFKVVTSRGSTFLEAGLPGASCEICWARSYRSVSARFGRRGLGVARAGSGSGAGGSAAAERVGICCAR